MIDKEAVAVEVASYILYLEKKPIEIKRLTTLMYMVEREVLIKTGHVLIGDTLVASQNGPSVMSVYNTLMHQRLAYIFPWKKWVKKNNKEEVELDKVISSESVFTHLSLAIRRIIQAIWWAYKDVSDSKFTEHVSHDCPEWLHVLTVSTLTETREITYMNILLWANMQYDTIKIILKEIEAQDEFDQVFAN